VPTYFGSNHYTIAQDLYWRGKRRGYPAGVSAAAAARARSATGRQEDRSAMNEEPTHKQSTLDTSARLAYERTYVSLISFGFTIAKVFAYLREKHSERGRFLAVGP
jgi:hypothetical protein